MNTNVTMGQMNPTAAIAINKGLLKTYNKKSDTPTYYLKKGQEFQIELFNRTQDYVLAKITLNNKLISQGGLVLRPGERVFLDRFLDVDKKFLFDTYEVSGGQAVQEAIKNNGDIKVEFYREKSPYLINSFYLNCNSGTNNPWIYGDCNTTTIAGGYVGNSSSDELSFTTSNIGNTSTFTSDLNISGSATLDWVDSDTLRSVTRNTKPNRVRRKNEFKKNLKSKKIETGRVEQGSKSDQKFTTVDREFEWFPFHTVSYKLLPQSQQNIETKDLHKRYCVDCGGKATSTDNFCSKCGQKL